MSEKKLELERLVFFSDAVSAIIVTIMERELKIPHDATWEVIRHIRFLNLN